MIVVHDGWIGLTAFAMIFVGRLTCCCSCCRRSRRLFQPALQGFVPLPQLAQGIFYFGFDTFRMRNDTGHIGLDAGRQSRRRPGGTHLTRYHHGIGPSFHGGGGGGGPNVFLLLELGKVLLGVTPDLCRGPGGNVGSHLFPFAAVGVQSLQKGLVFVFGPAARGLSSGWVGGPPGLFLAGGFL